MQGKSSPAERIPYWEAFGAIIGDRITGEGKLADPDFDYILADQLFDGCYKERNSDEDAREILNHICLGHNAPEDTVKRYREKKQWDQM